MKKFSLLTAAAFLIFQLHADLIDDARLLIDSGDYATARELLQDAARQKNPLANLYLGRIAFLEYDYPEAVRLYSSLKPSAASVPDYGKFKRELATGRQLLSHVEAITVIDSIAVDSASFFKNYVLSQSAGKLLDPAAASAMNRNASRADFAFTNELGDYMIWSEPADSASHVLVEGYRLVDGSWSEPIRAEFVRNDYEETDSIQDNSNRIFPFMLDDGQTLYFASDDENSLGGYDIYLSSKDPSDGSFNLPLNVGMPFNSPFDDYLLAIDPATGVGWWATDRNRLPGQVTVYVYLLPESRKNVDESDDNLIALARLSDFSVTRKEEDSSIIRHSLQTIDELKKRRPMEESSFFRLRMPGGKVYTSFSDFKVPAARKLMVKYLEESETLEADRKKLKELRKRYHSEGKKPALADQIASLEEKIEEERLNVKSKLSEIYRLEN